MKTPSIILVFILGILSNIFGQIPNNGFENWTSTVSYDDPNGWATMNSLCAGPFYSVTKSADHYPNNIGSFAIRIESNTSLTQISGGWGVIATKAFDFPFKPAFPITNNPERLCGYVKFIPENGDEAIIRIILFNNGTEVASSSTTITSTDEIWQPFSVEIDQYDAADSATIIVMSWTPMGPEDGPNGNSILYLDNLSFDNHISSIETPGIDFNWNIYPNPASNIIRFESTQWMEFPFLMNLYNASGTLVKTELIKENNQNILIQELSNGLYLIEIITPSYSKQQKLVIQR